MESAQQANYSRTVRQKAEYVANDLLSRHGWCVCSDLLPWHLAIGKFRSI